MPRTINRTPLVQDVLKSLRALVKANEAGKDLEAYLKAAAAPIVALRRTFQYDGRPDWGSNSMEYREFIGHLYRQAGVPADSEGPLQGKLRYHIGSALREVAPPEDLVALGMDPEGPQGRRRRARRADAVLRAQGRTHVEVKSGTRPSTERRERPRMGLVDAIEDPLVLAGFALDALRALQGRPRPKELEPLLRRVIEEAFTLVAAKK